MNKEGKEKMEKKKQMKLNRLLVGFATLGTLFMASGCASTCKVAGNFKPPVRKTVEVPARQVIVTQPVPTTTVVTQPVYVAPTTYYVAPRPCIYRPYRSGGYVIYGGRSGVPTAGTHLGNTMGGFRHYYREY